MCNLRHHTTYFASCTHTVLNTKTRFCKQALTLFPYASPRPGTQDFAILKSACKDWREHEVIELEQWEPCLQCVQEALTQGSEGQQRGQEGLGRWKDWAAAEVGRIVRKIKGQGDDENSDFGEMMVLDLDSGKPVSVQEVLSEPNFSKVTRRRLHDHGF